MRPTAHSSHNMYIYLLKTIRAYWSKRRVVTTSSFQNHLLLKENVHMVSPQTVFTYPFHRAKLQIICIIGHSTRLGHDCDGVNCYIRKCTIYYPWLWLLINIVVISYWRWWDWFHSNLKNNCECALIIKDNRWYIYGCNNWHRHKSRPNLVEWPYSLLTHTCWTAKVLSISSKGWSIQLYILGEAFVYWYCCENYN